MEDQEMDAQEVLVMKVIYVWTMENVQVRFIFYSPTLHIYIYIKHRQFFTIIHILYDIVTMDCLNVEKELTTVPQSIIISKNYPDIYDHSSNCSAKVTFSKNQNIVVYFLDFDVQQNSAENSECDKDYLEISSVSHKDRAMVDRLCGYTIPEPIALNASTAYLIFYSDASLGYDGFMIYLDTGKDV